MFTTTTITLDALFANSEGKKHHFRMKGFDPNKPAEKVKAALTKLTKLDIFEKDGIGLYKELLEAKMIQRTDTVLFKEERKKEQKTEEKDFFAQLSEMAAAMGYTMEEPGDILETLTLPQDLTIIEEQPDPRTLIQLIALPDGIDPTTLSEKQNYRVVTSCLPAKATLKECFIDSETTPAKLLVVSSLSEEEEGVPASVHTLSCSSFSEETKETTTKERIDPEIDPLEQTKEQTNWVTMASLPINAALDELVIDNAPKTPVRSEEHMEKEPVPYSCGATPRKIEGDSLPIQGKQIVSRTRHRLLKRIRKRE
ncbi:DUF2922 domain-containing protein [uncultured Enterococcus sp.]|uniref:DUF2922 domain-containing protein n=1 Tax=uncultured Enterococcus sp. TaxID=167972 RepID=UPI002584EB58|nr:DUF2922 domain-containing protein [uncultured Enterococcus sp.]